MDHRAGMCAHCHLQCKSNWATEFSTWQPLQHYCGPQGLADGSGNSIAVGHRVQQMAAATVLLWATGFSRWQRQQYCCGPQGSADGNCCCGPQGSADGSGNIIDVDSMVQQMAVATLLMWTPWFSRWQWQHY